MDIKTLVKTLTDASNAYYAGSPVMDDAEFDTLRDELEKLDPTNAFLKVVGAPVQVTVWPVQKHSRTIGSLAKVKHDEKADFLKWAKGKGDLILSEKLDGITIVATYKKGKLIHAVTRGNGAEGENITPNFIKMQNIKEDLDARFTGELRGEILLEKSLFNKHFVPLGYRNCRNAAAGKARDKKGKRGDNDLVVHLKVVWFQAVVPGLKTKLDEFKLIQQLGLQHVTYARFFDKRTPDDLWDRFEEYRRDKLDYLIDGLVVDCNDLSLHKKLGMVGGRPKAALAIKFESEGGITTINDITWQAGLTGRMCPVAEVEPINLAGATIARVTLNNLDYIKQLDVAIGDRVMVIRSNDVIPKITAVVDRSGREYLCLKCKK